MTRENVISRRKFLVAGGATAVAVGGCATNPVTGKKQLMFISEGYEIQIDKESAPHAFSAHYGAFQDKALNEYVNGVAFSMAPVTHRPGMPYNTRVVNAPMVNAYTFPGGSSAFARGLMIELENEAQFAAVMGHEMGHVSARHAASRMTSALIAETAVAVLGIYMQSQREKYASLAVGLGGIGANLLLSKYSRNDERQADALGMEYMSKAGYNPGAMSDVMAMFMRLSKRKPSSVEVLFATHPLDKERHQNAQKALIEKYPEADTLQTNRERYMDSIAKLRTQEKGIRLLQDAEALMLSKKPAEAEERTRQALAVMPDDYAGLLILSKCLLAQNKTAEAENIAGRAHQAYPSEPHALHLRGYVRTRRGLYQAALSDFTEYESKLPGNPNTQYFIGLSADKAGKKEVAARAYKKYLDNASDGEYAKSSLNRLVEWGYVAQPQNAAK